MNKGILLIIASLLLLSNISANTFNDIAGINLSTKDNRYYFQANLYKEALEGEQTKITPTPINVAVSLTMDRTWLPVNQLSDTRVVSSYSFVEKYEQGTLTGNLGQAAVEPVAMTGDKINVEVSNLVFITTTDSVPQFIGNDNFGIIGFGNSRHQNFLDMYALKSESADNGLFALQIKSETLVPQLYLTKNSFPAEVTTLSWFPTETLVWNLKLTQMQIGSDAFAATTAKPVLDVENQYIELKTTQYNRLKTQLGNSCQAFDPAGTHYDQKYKNLVICTFTEAELATQPALSFKLNTAATNEEKTITIPASSFLSKITGNYYKLMVKEIDASNTERDVQFGVPFFRNYFVAFNKAKQQIGLNFN